MKPSRLSASTAEAVPNPSGRPVEFYLSPIVLPGLIRALDTALIVTSGIISSVLLDKNFSLNTSYHVFCIIFVSFSYFFLAERSDLFSINSIMRPLRRSDDVLVAIVTVFLLFLSVIFALDASEHYSRLWITTFAASSFLMVMAARIGLHRILIRLWSQKSIGRSMVVLGVGEQSRRFLERLQRTKPFFIDVVGIFHGEQENAPESLCGYPVLGNIETLLAAARARKIDDVLVAMPWNADRHLADTIERLKELPVNVYLGTDLIGFELAFRPGMGNFAELPMFEVVRRPIAGWSSAVKTLMDYILATAFLILVSPVMAIIMVSIRLDSPGPIFFMQKRLGFNNKEFSIYKFRSMYHREIPERLVMQATRGDPRVTRVGRFIRSTSLDELPQLLNVLNGTMSIVGPRPHAISHNEEYGRQIRGYFARHKVKPGITGWAQVNGYRGETDTIEKMAARIQYDVFYTENWSLFFDFKIIIMTMLLIFFQKAAY